MLVQINDKDGIFIKAESFVEKDYLSQFNGREFKAVNSQTIINPSKMCDGLHLKLKPIVNNPLTDEYICDEEVGNITCKSCYFSKVCESLCKRKSELCYRLLAYVYPKDEKR
jgi:hypothetical protein